MNHGSGVSILLVFLLLQFLPTSLAYSNHAAATQNSNLFREYIGAEFKKVSFSDVPINPDVRFDFILSFAIDYTTGNPPLPANGNFSIFWDSDRLSGSEVSAIKAMHRNVRVAVSLGGDSVGERNASFSPASVDSWVSNAVSSLASIIQAYHLDGIDIDYEHFGADPLTFAECIGRLIQILKRKRLISTASIAPFDDEQVQSHYIQLWKKYAHLIDYVNFQFYGYGGGMNMTAFQRYFRKQASNYEGGKLLVSFISDGSLGLSLPDFFTACRWLKKENKLYGIFVWCADDSKQRGFRYEKKAQALLAAPSSII